LKELHKELGGFGLEVLILFSSGLEVEEHYFGGDTERIDNVTLVG